MSWRFQLVLILAALRLLSLEAGAAVKKRGYHEMTLVICDLAGLDDTTKGFMLSYSEVRSPIAGIVDVRASREGEVINAGQPIVTLINPDDLWVRADIEETYIDRIRLGDQLNVRLPSGETRMGTVFYRAMDASFATQRDVSRTKRDIKTFEIRLRVDNKDRRLAVGMTTYIDLPVM